MCGNEFKLTEMNLKGDGPKVSMLATQGCMCTESGALARDPVLIRSSN